MENALLYTFSTIAQALGGAFALLAAFLLYRFQILSKSLAEDAEIMSQIFPGNERGDYSHKCAQGMWRQVLGLVSAAVKKSTQAALAQPYGPNGRAPYIRLMANTLLHECLIRRFIGAALLTGIMLVGSVALIPCAHTLASHEHPAWLILYLFGVGGFSACLWFYWKVIALAVGLESLRHREMIAAGFSEAKAGKAYFGVGGGSEH